MPRLADTLPRFCVPVVVVKVERQIRTFARPQIPMVAAVNVKGATVKKAHENEGATLMTEPRGCAEKRRRVTAAFLKEV